MTNVTKTSTIQLINILSKRSESELLVLESDLTIGKALEGTTLNKLSKDIDKINVIKSITFLTTRLADNFNVGKKFSTEQATLMAFDLFEVFGWETIEDVVLMFKMARQGKIGDGKDFKLDSQTVFHKWIPQYLELKADFRESNYLREKAEYIKDHNSVEKVTQKYKEIELKNFVKRVESFVEETTKDFDRQMLEDLITDWEKDEVRKPYVYILKNKRKTIPR